MSGELFPHFRILICGSQKWTKRSAVKAAIYGWLSQQNLPPNEDLLTVAVTLIHGGAKGADACASSIANTDGMSEQVTPALKGAARGQWMPKTADVLLAFPVGQSTHTRAVMQLAELAGIPVENHGDVLVD